MEHHEMKSRAGKDPELSIDESPSGCADQPAHATDVRHAKQKEVVEQTQIKVVFPLSGRLET